MHEFEELPRLTVTEKINKMNDIENHFMPLQVECNVCLKMLSQSSLGNHMKQHDGLKIEDKSGIFLLSIKMKKLMILKKKNLVVKYVTKKH